MQFPYPPFLLYLLRQLLQLPLKAFDLQVHFLIIITADPLHIIFQFLDISKSLQDVCDVVDAPFGDLQLGSGLVQVDLHLRLALDKQFEFAR